MIWLPRIYRRLKGEQQKVGIELEQALQRLNGSQPNYSAAARIIAEKIELLSDIKKGCAPGLHAKIIASNAGHTNETYLAEREKNFPVGSEGVLLAGADVGDVGRIGVMFDHEGIWNGNWTYLSVYGRNVGSYHLDEITVTENVRNAEEYCRFVGIVRAIKRVGFTLRKDINKVLDGLDVVHGIDHYLAQRRDAVRHEAARLLRVGMGKDAMRQYFATNLNDASGLEEVLAEAKK